MIEDPESPLSRPEPVGLPRPRLLDPLVDVHGPGVVVVTAQAGSGKTTLLARAASTVTVPAAWCPTAPEHRSAPAFVDHLARCCSSALGLDLGRPASAAELVEALVGARAGPLLLLLDDVHELAGSSAEAELSTLLRWRPREVRMVIGTRRALPVNTPRLQVCDELVELDNEALRFRSWEVEELFRVVYDEPLSPEGAAALTRRTGGWAAGLKLFQLATAGKSAADRERAVVGLGGRSRLLRSYLTRTVLDELDPERREFLLVTSTLGTLTGGLCDALLDSEGSAAVLEELALRQFFTIPAEDGFSYRYHQVLQTLLEGLLLDERGPRRAAETYGRSARLLEAEGLLPDAVRGYALAGDFGSVARLVQHSGADLPGVGLTDGAPLDDPWLALARARRLQRLGAVADAVTAFRHAESLLDDADFRTRCMVERESARLWLPDPGPGFLPGRAAGPPRTLTEAARRLTIHHDEEEVTGAGADPLIRGLRHLLRGEVAAAGRAFATPAPDAGPFALLVADLGAAVSGGTAVGLVARLEEIVLVAEVDDLPWLARLARGLQASVLLATTDEPWRQESCAAVVEDCRRGGDAWGAALLTGCLGVALAFRGDPGAGDWLARAARSAADLRAPVLQAWAETWGAEVLAPTSTAEAADQARRARHRARGCGLPDLETPVSAWLRSVGGAAPPTPLPSPGAAVRVRCLGDFTLEVGGRPVRLPSLRPRPRSLLLVLALHLGHDVHREVLLDLLWPDVRVEAATHRLHAATSSLRGCLAEAGLGHTSVERHGSAYALRLPGAVLDVDEFQDCLDQATRAMVREDHPTALRASLAALRTYRGDLLTEAGPADWVVGERDRLRVAAASAAYTAARLSLALRAPEEALTVARRATALDPLRDSAWGLLADVQARMGDFTAAEATRREQAEVTAQLVAR